MKVLLTGSAGMLGKDLTVSLQDKSYEVIALPKRELDIIDYGVVKDAVDTSQPDLIINCAAYTKVDEAEEQEHLAKLVNGLAVQNLCILCQQHDIPLVHFSTDYVFDGSKNTPYATYDEPNPVNAYGRSKLLGENYILWLLTKFYLIRTSWLFGHHGKNFIEIMLEAGRNQKQVPVVTDQKGCPTWTTHLAEATVALVETDRYGIYHVTNSEPTTWFDFAKEIFSLSRMKTQVLPATSEQFPRAAKRPKNSVLDQFPLKEVIGKEMPSWKEALREYLSHYQGKVSS